MFWLTWEFLPSSLRSSGPSFKNEGPLDLRLDPFKGETAAERLKKLNFEELKGMLIENSDEP